jgi:sensor domain CHASE-containing protein
MDTKDNKIIQIKKNLIIILKKTNKQKINNYIQEKIKKKFNIIKNKIKTNINTTKQIIFSHKTKN